MQNIFPQDPLIRLPFYVALGLVSEVLFTGTIDLILPQFLKSWNAKGTPSALIPIGRDPRLMGYSFLWMIPIYAGLILIEPIFYWIHLWPLFVRGLFYLVLFWIGEYASGFVIKKITGQCPWDYSYSRFSFHGYIRWDFAPIWFTFALIVEKFSQKMILLTPSLKLIMNP